MEQPKRERSSISLTLSAALMVCVLATVLIQVFARYLRVSPTWTEEMVRWFWVWTACLGLGSVEQKREHVSMNYLPTKLPAQARAILFFIFDLATLAVSVNLAWLSWKTVRVNWDTYAATVPLSRGFFYSSILAGSALMTLHSSIHVTRTIASLASRQKKIEQKELT